MFCEKCGTKLSDDAMFCTNCGKAIAHQSDTFSEKITQNTYLQQSKENSMQNRIQAIVLTFDVIASSPCTTKISVSASDAIDAQDNPVSLKASEATVTVTAKTKGDVNGDGKVTVTDAKWVLQASSGSRTLTDVQRAAADVNGDGKVTVTDAKWLLQVASGSRVL